MSRRTAARKAGSIPLGGTARSAKGAPMSRRTAAQKAPR